MDIVPVAFGLFTVAVGIMFGAWFRRTMLALGVTLGFVIAIAIVMPVVIRPHYMTPVTVTSPMGPEYQNMVPKGAWVLSRNIANQNGQAVGDIFPAAPTQCQQIIQQMQVRSGNGQIAIKVTPGAGNPVDTCLNKAGWHQTETYQPSYRYWDFQRIETVIYLGLAAIVIAATYWLVLKRDA